MGWLYSTDWDSKATLIRHLTADGFAGEGSKCLAKCVRGNALWTVFERPIEGRVPLRMIVLFLVQSHRTGEVYYDGWGYKDVDESMGPCEVSCPGKFLDMVPDPGGYATAWRERVRAVATQNAARRAAVKVGQRVYLRAGCRPSSVVIESAQPLRGSGYRLRLKHIDPDQGAARARVEAVSA